MTPVGSIRTLVRLGPGRGWEGSLAPVAVAVAAGAWFTALLAQLSGFASVLHHDALIQATLPIAVKAPLFLAGFLVMTAAMMLPASLPALRQVELSGWGLDRGMLVPVGFLGAFFAAWAAFGVGAMVGDLALHRLVEVTPWLASRPWSVAAGALVLTGVYQLVPLKRRGLERCRHPSALARRTAGASEGVRRGLVHAFDCFLSAGPLMLLMFAAGVGNLAWMTALTGVMAYESLGRGGPRVSLVVGLLLVGFGIAVLVSGGAVDLAGMPPAAGR